MRIEKVYDFTLEDPNKNLESWVDEVADDFKTRTKVEMNEKQREVLKSALGYRLSTHKIKDGEFGGSVFDDIIGVYTAIDTDDNNKTYIIEINSEPAHVLNRTTGRPGYSCEQIDQHWWLGPFHDIALRNVTAYYWEQRGQDLVWVGRLNIRWCIDTDSGEFNIGIDPNIYPMFQTGRRNDDFLQLATWEIMTDAGFMDYEYALTPYIYKGHSDTTPSGDVRLPFKGWKFYT